MVGKKTSPEEQERQRQIGINVARARDRRGMTQRGLSTALGYSASWLQKVENGSNAISVFDLERVSKITGASLDLLLGADIHSSPSTRAEFRQLFPDPIEADALFEVHDAFERKRLGWPPKPEIEYGHEQFSPTKLARGLGIQTVDHRSTKPEYENAPSE